jgi:hypothetical protein
VKTYVDLWSFLAEFLEWEMFQTKLERENMFYVSLKFFRKSCSLWENAVHPDRAQIAMQCGTEKMRFHAG